MLQKKQTFPGEGRNSSKPEDSSQQGSVFALEEGLAYSRNKSSPALLEELKDLLYNMEVSVFSSLFVCLPVKQKWDTLRTYNENKYKTLYITEW